MPPTSLADRRRQRKAPASVFQATPGPVPTHEHSPSQDGQTDLAQREVDEGACRLVLAHVLAHKPRHFSARHGVDDQRDSDSISPTHAAADGRVVCSAPD